MARSRKETKNQRWLWVAPLAVVLCGFLAYCNSFQGPFVFDDMDGIRDNPTLGGQSPHFAMPLSPHMVGPPPVSTTLTSRPVLWITFWLNSLIAGRDQQDNLRVEVFHVTNLLIHLANSLLIYGIVRRNLSRKQTWGDQFAQSAPWLAAATAAIWAVHPLTTESVTYIIQRAESLASLFYLATIYCVIRSADDKRPMSNWAWAAIAFCALGGTTKEIVATAPLLILVYDRTFLSGSFAAALRTRKWLYVGMVASWPLLGFLALAGKGRGGTVGFTLGLSVLEYARTQLGAIAHYLRLIVWPTGLAMSLFNWPIARQWSDIPPAGFLVALLIILSTIAFWKAPRLGFPAVWFFLILAPSSSFIPIVTEIVSEHRMYLPLAGPVALFVVGGWMVARRWHAQRIAIATAAAITIALIALTINRNSDYSTAIKLWSDNVATWPDNPQAHANLGYAYGEVVWSSPHHSPQRQAAARQAEIHFRRVYELLPGYEVAQVLGHLMAEAGDPQTEKFYDMILKTYPQHPDLMFEAHMMRGQLRGERKDFDGARDDFLAATAIPMHQPESDASAHFMLGFVLENLHDMPGAEAEFVKALQIDPKNRDAHRELQRIGSQPQTGQ